MSLFGRDIGGAPDKKLGESRWHVEVHNPTDNPAKTTLHLNPHFDPLQAKALPPQPITVPAGTSITIEL